LYLSLCSALVALSGCGPLSQSPEAHVERAKALLDTNDYRGGVLELKNALQADPDNAESRWLLGEAYLKLGQGEDAEKELQRAEALGISAASLQTQFVRASLQQGAYAAALEKAIPAPNATDKQKALLLSMQGEARIGLREPTSGCPLFSDALRLDSQLSEAYRGLARCAMHARDATLARSQMQSAIKIAPTDIENWILQGEIELDQNDLKAAEKSFSRALAIEPEHRNALVKHALIALATQQQALAQKDLDVLKKTAPKSAEMLFLDASFKYHQGKYQAALPPVQELLGQQSGHVQTNMLAGLILYETKSYQQAIAHFSKVVKRLPGRLDARKYLASAQLLAGDSAAAYQTLAPVALTSRDPQILALFSQSQQARGETTAALATLSQAQQLAPNNSAILTRLAYLHFQIGDDAQAFNTLQAVMETPGQIGSADVLEISELIKNKRTADAIGAADTLVQRAPNNPVAHNLKGMAYSAAGDPKRAYASFEQAYTLNPDAIAAILNLAQLDILAKTPDKSIARLTRYVNKFPKHAQALTTLAELEARKGNRDGFDKWIDKALKADAAYVPAHAMRVSALLSAGRTEQALAAARNAINVAPDNPVAQSLLADVQYARNDLDNAIAGYTKIAQRTPTQKLLFRLANAQAAANKSRDAIATLEKSRSFAPGDLETLALLANLRIEAKQFSQAKPLVEELKQRFPKSATGWYQEGLMLDAQGQIASALDAYRKAHAIANDSRSATYLHMALVRNDQADAANALLADWLKRYPDDLGVRRHLAGYLAQTGQAKSGAEHYLIVLRQAPNDVQAMNNLAILFQSLGDKRALAYAEKAAKAAPNAPLIKDTLGWIQTQNGQLDKGIATLQNAHKALPGNPEIALHLATALYKRGDKRGAREIAQPAASRDSPQQAELRALLGKL
jgi:putative PEP-CTERM system TPR-repeat lipoprotein